MCRRWSTGPGVLIRRGNAECIFRDLEGRAGRIAIDLISEEMRRSLDTNPHRARPGEPEPPTARPDPQSGSYAPTNGPAIGDLMDMFTF